MDGRVYVYQLAAFSESEKKTLRLISSYIYNNNTRCFNYRKLRAYWDKKRMWRVIEWHTVERNIRRFAELGWLERQVSKKDRRKVMFCASDELLALFRGLKWL